MKRAGGGVAIAALMWFLGHHAVAVAIVIVMLVLTAVCDLSPAAARRVERIERAIQRGAGRVLSLVLLGAVQALVFAPAALVLRLVRHDPLSRGRRRAGATTAWLPAPVRQGRPLFDRPYAYEVMGDQPSGRGVRLRAALGALALVLLLDVAIGALVHAVDDEPSTAGETRLFTTADAAAGRSEPWRHQLGDELNTLWKSSRYDPYLGWTHPDYRSRYVNVRDGVRRSYQPQGGGRRPVEVFFFGGSAMFGLFQRDGHTIPSELARLAEADGIRLRPVNYGRLAYVNWQEALLMQQLAARGAVPDLAVFYDGFNELLSQFQLGLHREPTHLESEAIEARLREQEEGSADEPSRLRSLYDSWAGVSAVHEAGRKLGIGGGDDEWVFAESAWKGDQADHPERRGRYAAELHGRGMEVVASAVRGRPFEARFFWQPSIFSKRVAAGEEPFEGWLGADPDAWRAADRAARARMSGSVEDLGDALDATRKPVMYDFVHTNELGARKVAEALYERLRPALRRLARENAS